LDFIEIVYEGMDGFNWLRIGSSGWTSETSGFTKGGGEFLD
jgi:hypothetical protein